MGELGLATIIGIAQLAVALIAIWIAVEARNRAAQTDRVLAESLDLARQEKKKSEHAQAAYVLEVRDVLAVRVKDYWLPMLEGDAFEYALTAGDQAERIEEDIELGAELRRRAASVDMEAVIHAWHVYTDLTVLQFDLRSAARHASSPAPITRAGTAKDRRLVAIENYRKQAEVRAERIVEHLQQLEHHLPEEATKILGEDREMFADRIRKIVEDKAEARVEAKRGERATSEANGSETSGE